MNPRHPVYREDLTRAIAAAGDLSPLKNAAVMITGATESWYADVVQYERDVLSKRS